MKLQDALTAVADRVIPESEWWAGWREYLIIVEAAKRVANPDIDAAVNVVTNHRPGVGPVTDRRRVVAIVNAALGIPEDE